MANEILSKRGASTALVITLSTLANGAARQSTQVNDPSPSAPMVEVFYKITTGAPTANSVLEFYLSKADDDATAEHADGGTGPADADFTGDLNTLLPVHTQVVDATLAKAYQGSFLIPEPGTDWRLVVKNSTGSGLNGTPANHYIRYRSVIPEAQ